MKATQFDEILFYDQKPNITSFEDEVHYGLSKEQKYIPPKFFYDQYGSFLFTEICELQEYYLTRTEISILKENIKDIIREIGETSVLIEFGSGASEKIKILLSEIRQSSCYLGVDISKNFLIDSCKILATEYPLIDVTALCADYSQSILIPEIYEPYKQKTIFFPGSSFGNFSKLEQLQFLKNVRSYLNEGDGFLIGVDLIKNHQVLEAAYNDKKEITEKFNLNILARINRELGGHFHLSAFQHRAFFNEEESRIEMHLVSLKQQDVRIGNASYHFERGESIHTENSYKFYLHELKKMFEMNGFEMKNHWKDGLKRFAVCYFQASINENE